MKKDVLCIMFRYTENAYPGCSTYLGFSVFFVPGLLPNTLSGQLDSTQQVLGATGEVKAFTFGLLKTGDKKPAARKESGLDVIYHLCQNSDKTI